MKITCPKCDSSYKVDLPDPGEAGIDVQCGKCLHVFLFSTTDIEKSKESSLDTQDSSLSEDQSSGTILPPQKDEDQEVSGSQKQPHQSQKQESPLTEEDQEDLEELELEPIVDDPEPIEVVVEDEAPEESLEEGALEDIWDQAVQEGARTVAESKEKPPIGPPRNRLRKKSMRKSPKKLPQPLRKSPSHCFHWKTDNVKSTR